MKWFFVSFWKRCLHGSEWIEECISTGVVNSASVNESAFICWDFEKKVVTDIWISNCWDFLPAWKLLQGQGRNPGSQMRCPLHGHCWGHTGHIPILHLVLHQGFAIEIIQLINIEYCLMIGQYCTLGLILKPSARFGELLGMRLLHYKTRFNR